jgi:hypothetical protein
MARVSLRATPAPRARVRAAPRRVRSAMRRSPRLALRILKYSMAEKPMSQHDNVTYVA